MGKLAIVTALLLTSFIARAEDLVFDQPEEVVVVNKTDKTANTAKKNEKDLPYSEEELNKFSPEKFNDKSDK